MVDDIFIGVMVAILIALMVFVAWLTAVELLRNTAPSRKGFWFIYHGIPRHVDVPNLECSRYYDRFPVGRNNWEWRATLDCQAMNQIASELEKRFKGKSDRYKAGYILAMVQQGVRYEYDQDLYGEPDRFAFPVCMAYLHKGDCEDSALLGTCLSKLCGLDVAVFYVWGHLAYGVNLGEKKGKGLEFDGKWFQWCESTGIWGIGHGDDTAKVLDIFYPEVPPKDYVEKHTVQEDFDKFR